MPMLNDSYTIYEDNQWWYAWKERAIGNAEEEIITELRALIDSLQK